MNIFLTSPDPCQCALSLDNKRLSAMVRETAQLLATACFSIGANIGYAPTHINHPCARWCRQSSGNFAWLIEHGLELAKEFEKRFGHAHASEEIIIRSHKYLQCFKARPVSFDFNCSGYNSGNVFEDYKSCLRDKWKKDQRQPKWTRRGQPSWR